MLARDAGAGVCDGTGCTPAAGVHLGLKSITYYVTADAEPSIPVIGPVTVELRCLDAARWGWSDPNQGIYRPIDASASADGFLYDVTSLRVRDDHCATFDTAVDGSATGPQALALGVIHGPARALLDGAQRWG